MYILPCQTTFTYSTIYPFLATHIFFIVRLFCMHWRICVEQTLEVSDLEEVSPLHFDSLLRLKRIPEIKLKSSRLIGYPTLSSRSKE